MIVTVFRWGLAFLVVLISTLTWGQDVLHGTVTTLNEDGHSEPVPFANVHWLNTQTGTISDSTGAFQIPITEESQQLVVSYVGFRSDTVTITENTPVLVQLRRSVELDEVEVAHRKASTSIGYMSTIKTENVSEQELFKAPCCNLSESFETNPSVDVAFSDAITGTRQVQMLGLAGPYTLFTLENIRALSGLGVVYGLGSFPGAWLESMQLSKGTGAVMNGPESVSGLINVELKKPEPKWTAYLNGYVNEGGRRELNAVATAPVTKRWQTAVLAHASERSQALDRNGDGFADNPTGNQINMMNRWLYNNGKGHVGQVALRYFDDRKNGGQIGDSPGESKWTSSLNNEMLEAWAKTGLVFPNHPFSSVGFQAKMQWHKLDADFTTRQLAGEEKRFYANGVYQAVLGNTDHQLKAGMNYLYVDYRKMYQEGEWTRMEKVPGIYTEYTWKPASSLDVIAGLRYDYHNLFGGQWSPRLNTRWEIREGSVARLAVGRAWRTANVLVENTVTLVSNRSVQFVGVSNPSQFAPEEAWNAGVNFTQDFRLNYRNGTISLDAYHTRFTNQVVADLDQSSRTALFYNLDGESYANSFQAMITYEPVYHLDVKLAYRLFDVRTDYRTGRLQKPLVSRHRGFVNMAYETLDQWMFDFTANWQGSKRIPFTGDASPDDERPAYSPAFWIFSTQVSKLWKRKWEVYAGVENLTNFRQEQPIIGADTPMGDNFDASLVWGPVFGRNIYAGFRWWIGDMKRP